MWRPGFPILVLPTTVDRLVPHTTLGALALPTIQVGVTLVSRKLSEFSESEMLSTIETAMEFQFADDDFEFYLGNLAEYVEWGDWDGVLESVGWTLKYLDGYGGEGKGDEYWFVFTVTDGTTTRHVKVDGWYQSYNGGEYDKWFEVFPKKKEITVWSQKA